MSWLGEVTPWHWWILGVVLLVLETFAPGTFFLWPAVAAAIMGLVVLVIPGISWEFQVLLFAILSVTAVVAWRSYRRRAPEESVQPLLNRRAQQYVGRTFMLAEPIVNGHGRVRVDDTIWRAEGADLPAGANVKVIGVDGVVLRVEPVHEQRVGGG